MTARQDLKDKRTPLRLTGMADQLGASMEPAAQKNLDRLTTLTRLADIELAQRFPNAIALRWKQAKLTEKLPIDQVDFAHHTSRQEQKTRMLHLLNLDVVRAHMEVMRIGNPGAGKTFLAKCLAYAACTANITVLFATASAMINHLIAAEADHARRKKRQHYQTPDLLGGDEMGYLSLGPQGSHLFFQVISGRHQHTSTVITTTLPFAEGGKVFDATPGATAIADRLVHNSEVLLLGGTRSRRKLT